MSDGQPGRRTELLDLGAVTSMRSSTVKRAESSDLFPRERSARHRSGHRVQQVVVRLTAVTETAGTGWPVQRQDR